MAGKSPILVNIKAERVLYYSVLTPPPMDRRRLEFLDRLRRAPGTVILHAAPIRTPSMTRVFEHLFRNAGDSAPWLEVPAIEQSEEEMAETFTEKEGAVLFDIRVHSFIDMRYRAAVSEGGLTYPTLYHSRLYVHLREYKDEEVAKAVLRVNDPLLATLEACRRCPDISEDEVNDQEVNEMADEKLLILTLLKFLQHDSARRVLLSTGRKNIYACDSQETDEINSTGISIERWTKEATGRGSNQLGTVLAGIRDALRRIGEVKIAELKARCAYRA